MHVDNIRKIKDIMTKTESKGYFKKNQCAVCGSYQVELHHFAPKYLFGDDSDNWPTAYLCREHHKQWHDIVTPNMCKINLK